MPEIIETPDTIDPTIADPPSPDANAEAQGAADEGLVVDGDRGDGRDAHGRFVGKGDQGDGEAREEDAGTATGDTGQAPADASAPTPETAAPDAAAEPEGTPFAIPYRGQEFEVPGARLTEKGLFVPREHVELVGTFIGKGVKLEHERAELKRARYIAEIEGAKYQASNRELDALMEIAQIKDETQFAEALLTYGLELRAALPTLERERQISQREAELRLREEMGRPDADEQVQQVERAIAVTFDGYVSHARQDPGLSGMTDGDWKAVQEWMQQYRRALIVTAGPRLTQEEQAAGIRPGETYFARDPVDAFVRHTAALRKEALEAAEKTRKAIEDARKVAERNAKKIAAASAQDQPPTPAPASEPAARGVGTSAQDREARKQAYLREMGLAL